MVQRFLNRQKQKGSVQDLVTIATAVFTFGLTLLIAMRMMQGFNQYQFFATSEAMAAAGQALSIMDYGSVFLTVGLFVVSILLASQTPSSPVFLPISLLSLALAVFVSAQLGNVYAVISSTGAFQTVAGSLPFSTKMLYNFPYIIGVGGFMIILALYARSGDGGGIRAPR